MTGTATISIYARPMPVRTISRNLRRTAIELVIEPVTIPETDVRRLGMLNWMVDACVGDGESNGNRLLVWLPAEPVRWWWSRMTMVAEAITCPVRLILADDSFADGSVVFPDCAMNLFTGIAEGVTATGSVMFD